MTKKDEVLNKWLEDVAKEFENEPTDYEKKLENEVNVKLQDFLNVDEETARKVIDICEAIGSGSRKGILKDIKCDVLKEY